jgi:hypothetical protein
MALIFTALLGIAGYVVQSKNATAADRAQHEIVQEAADREQVRGLAAIQLERVRSQMAEVLMPLAALIERANVGHVWMGRELRFEEQVIWDGPVTPQFMSPFKLWPHIEVWSRDFLPNPTFMKTFRGSPYRKYSPVDIALLDDPTKRDIYIDAHTSCIAPCYREVTKILSTKGHLIQRPPAAFLDKVFPDGISDWAKFVGGSLIAMQHDMAAFGDAYAPLERRWEAGDFSRMQPAQANPWSIINMVVNNMMQTTGARQKELEGASAMSGRVNAQGDTFTEGAASAETDT